MRDWVYGFFMAWGMFLAIPCPRKIWSESARQKMLVCMPLVGLLAGGVWAGAWLLLRGAPGPVRAAVCAAAPWLVTGFMHLDGYMDVCDAVLSRRDLATRQRILKDSHCGAFAVICMVLLAMGQWSLFLAAEDVSWLGLLLIPAATRACAGLAVLGLRPMGTSQYAAMGPARGGYGAALWVLLALLAALFAWVLGLGTGIIAAIRQNSLVDHLFMGVSLAGVSMPIFMVALLLQYLIAFKIKAFPLTLDGTFLSMILPAIALGWNSAGSIARMTRSSLLEVMQADYIDTARAKGLRKQAVILGHALKNSMLPVITMMALQFSGMLSGAVITESIFAIPGIGRLATTAIQNRDMPVLQGTVLFTTVLVIAGNLIADLLYSVLDPRIRKEA